MAVLIPTTLGLLVRPLHREFGWTSPQILFATVFNTTGVVLMAPFISGLVKRFGARRIIYLSFATEAILRWLIDRYDWRDLFLCQAAIITIFVLPILLLCIRNEPESIGLPIDGIPDASAGSVGTKQANEAVTLKQATATRQYWFMLATFLPIGTAVTSVIFHLFPLLEAHRESAQLASQAQGGQVH